MRPLLSFTLLAALALPASLALPACNDGGVSSDNASLVGTWSGTIGTQTLSYTFSSDGSFTMRPDSNTTATGTFTINGDQLTLDGSVMGMDRARITQRFHVSGDRLALPAFLADGAVQGLVGRWKSSYGLQELGVSGEVTKTNQLDQTMEVRGDGTLTFTADSGGPTPSVNSGTWTSTGADTYQVQLSGTTQSIEVLDGKAWGMPVLRKLTR